VAAAAREAGKFAGTVGGVANLDALVADGYQFINMGSDIRAFTGSCETILQEFKKRRPLAG
jgi:2-keto-3-deoxy-L-rhamnonate aldolase RhmA